MGRRLSDAASGSPGSPGHRPLSPFVRPCLSGRILISTVGAVPPTALQDQHKIGSRLHSAQLRARSAPPEIESPANRLLDARLRRGRGPVIVVPGVADACDHVTQGGLPEGRGGGTDLCKSRYSLHKCKLYPGVTNSSLFGATTAPPVGEARKTPRRPPCLGVFRSAASSSAMTSRNMPIHWVFLCGRGTYLWASVALLLSGPGRDARDC